MSYADDTDNLFTDDAVTAIQDLRGVDPQHVRTQIRDYYVALFQLAINEPEKRVHSDPTLSIQGREEQFEVPAINITVRDESAGPYSKEPDSRRELELVVVVYAAATETASVDTVLDAIVLGVEALIADMDETLTDTLVFPSQIETVDLRSTEKSYDADGQHHFGTAALSFTVVYSTT